jgi:DNA-binding transcriptional LysR family regulator
MNLNKLSRVDLNLLVALQALLEERSVSRAADRLAITQPAMSKTLSRLRDTFKDPLFSRSKRGIQPTPRAQALSIELQQILGNIDTLLNSGDFDPAQYQGEMTVAISEYVGFTLLPPLTARLQNLAPKLRLRTITRAEGQLDMLASGDLDFSIQIARGHYPDLFRTHPLASSPLAVFVRRDHPLVGETLSVTLLEQYPSISLYVADRSDLMVEAERGEVLIGGHQGTLETSHLLTAFEILRETDYILFCPAYLARSDGATRDIVALPMPAEYAQTVEYTLVAHQRTQQSPVHQWLWDQIIDTVKTLRVRTVHRG